MGVGRCNIITDWNSTHLLDFGWVELRQSLLFKGDIKRWQIWPLLSPARHRYYTHQYRSWNETVCGTSFRLFTKEASWLSVGSCPRPNGKFSWQRRGTSLPHLPKRSHPPPSPPPTSLIPLGQSPVQLFANSSSLCLRWRERRLYLLVIWCWEIWIQFVTGTWSGISTDLRRQGTERNLVCILLMRICRGGGFIMVSRFVCCYGWMRMLILGLDIKVWDVVAAPMSCLTCYDESWVSNSFGWDSTNAILAVPEKDSLAFCRRKTFHN